MMMGTASALAQDSWFNVIGDPHDIQQNTVEVDVVPISSTPDGLVRTMRLRVSRSEQRKSWDGIPYRSYLSQVEFNCRDRTARYINLTYFMQPGWMGESHASSTHPASRPRWMRFVDMNPNPTERLIRAACQPRG